jgi:hypothetical protein
VSAVLRSDSIALLRRNRAYLTAGALPFALGIGFIVAALVTGTAELLIPVPHSAILGALAFAYAYRSNKDPVALPGPLEITEGEIRYNGERLASRKELADGVIVPDEGKVRVRLRKKSGGRDLLFEVADRAEGHALLRALGFDATQSVAEVRGASDALRWPVSKMLAYILLPIFFLFMPLVLAGGFALGPTGMPVFGVFMVLALLTYIFGLVLSPTRVRIGVDGVLAKWVNTERFIPFSRVTEVRKYSHESAGKTYLGVELALEDGTAERILCGQEGWTKTEQDEMFERIREAYELHQSSGGDLPPEVLVRGDRNAREWVNALRAIGSGASADMRTAPVHPDALIRIVEDARAPAELRVGAAVAAIAGGADARERVRIAAETTASEKLRVALETVARSEDDEEAIAEALEGLEAERATR